MVVWFAMTSSSKDHYNSGSLSIQYFDTKVFVVLILSIKQKQIQALVCIIDLSINKSTIDIWKESISEFDYWFKQKNSKNVIFA